MRNFRLSQGDTPESLDTNEFRNNLIDQISAVVSDAPAMTDTDMDMGMQSYYRGSDDYYKQLDGTRYIVHPGEIKSVLLRTYELINSDDNENLNRIITGKPLEEKKRLGLMFPGGEPQYDAYADEPQDDTDLLPINIIFDKLNWNTNVRDQFRELEEPFRTWVSDPSTPEYSETVLPGIIHEHSKRDPMFEYNLKTIFINFNNKFQQVQIQLDIYKRAVTEKDKIDTFGEVIDALSGMLDIE